MPIRKYFQHGLGKGLGPGTKGRSELERLFDLIFFEPNTGCWIWGGNWDRFGYGRTSINCGHSRFKFAHRVAYELLVGPIPNNLPLDHKCRVHCCVNPAHLEPVTHKENVRRGIVSELVSKRRRAMTHCKRGHPFSGENLAVNSNGSRRCLACCRMRTKLTNKKKRKGPFWEHSGSLSGILSFGA